MGVKSANQHLRVYVSNAAPVAIDGTGGNELSTLPAGGVTYVAKNTAIGVATPPTTGSYRVHYKGLDGNLYISPIVNVSDIIRSDVAIAAVAEVQQVDTLTIPGSIVGQSYIAKLRVPNYGGLISPQDEVFFYGNYTAIEGDTAVDIATGLGASLKKACDNAPVAFADITWSATDITATGIAQPYVQSKWDGRLVNFDLTLARPISTESASVKTTAGNAGTGTGKQVASMEEFYAGYNEGFKNRTANFPYDTAPVFATDVSKLYQADSVIFKANKYGSNDMSQRQTMIVFHTPA